VVTFAAGGEVAGYLSLLAANGAADQEARLALAGAGLAASIEALRVRTVAEAQGNALASLVRDWLAGRFTSTGELAERAAQLGHPPAPPYGVVVIESSQPLLEDDLQRIARTLKSQSSIGEGRARLVSRNGVGGSAVEETTERGTLSATMDDRRTALLVPLADPPALEGATAPLHQLLASLGDGQGRRAAVFAGIGRPATRVEDVPRAYRDAAGAAATARRLGGQHRVAYFGALGVYRVLAAVSPGEELASFYEDTLGPLVAHDRKSGGELLRTLEAYVSCGGSPLESAQRLHAHRNTVLYRLDRISEILGVDVREPEQRLVLHLALRAGQLLEERPARQVLSA
jgi:purine catabolism regulator